MDTDRSIDRSIDGAAHYLVFAFIADNDKKGTMLFLHAILDECMNSGIDNLLDHALREVKERGSCLKIKSRKYGKATESKFLQKKEFRYNGCSAS